MILHIKIKNLFNKKHTKTSSTTNDNTITVGGMIYDGTNITTATDGSITVYGGGGSTGAGGLSGVTGPNINAGPNINWGVDIKHYCRVCGNENGELSSHRRTIPTLCDKCDEKFVQDALEKMMPKDSKVHCKQCKFHIKACNCPAKNALAKLKK